jgi:hypothetical protein
MAFGIFVGLIAVFVVYGVLWAVRKDPSNPVFGDRSYKPPPVPDPKPERLQAAGLPPSPRFRIGPSTPENFGGLLGSGTPSMGPAPPSIGYEPEVNTVRVEATELPPSLRVPGLDEE